MTTHSSADNPRLASGEFATVEGCAQALASGQVTAAQLVQHGLARIAEFDDGPDGLNAVITLNPDALAAARASDRRRLAGKPLSALDGIPFTVKDCIEDAGLPTTHGSPAFANSVPEHDAPVVAALRDAGMVLLAKVALDDFAAACWGESALNGVTRNPYDVTRMVGGSSGGSAVAVAAGYAPLSLGTDTGGSLRIPAALCGVATLRPSAGVLSQAGVFPRSWSQDTVGPMALTVAGLQLAFAALRGTPAGASAVDAGPFVTALETIAPAVELVETIGTPAVELVETKGVPTAPKLSGLRLGVVFGGLAIWGDDPNGPVLQRFRTVLATLQAHGVQLIPIQPPAREVLDSAAIDCEAIAAVDQYLARPGMPVHSFDELFAPGAMSEHALLTFSRHREAEIDDAKRANVAQQRELLRAQTEQIMAEHQLDAIIYPSVHRDANPIGEEQAGVFTRWSEHTGLPAVGLPIGLATGTHLPCSAELLGHPNQDEQLLTIARAVEQAISLGG